MIRNYLTVKSMNNQEGYVLIVSLLMMVVLTAYGIFALTTSSLEIQIAGNDKVQRQTFVQADGGTQTGAMVLEENISCPIGFNSAPLDLGYTQVTTVRFWNIETEPAGIYPSDAVRHMFLPRTAVPADPHTNLYFYGDSGLSTGNAIQMIAGYETTGYGAAAGGGYLATNINSQRLGLANSESSLRGIWKHIIGQEGTCRY